MKLDTLVKINDLREVWKNEATDFTPWLAKEENLALLSETIGIDISLEETESNVGSFNVDIFATEEGTSRKIIIENQLEDTNHDHLGKLITYASGKNAEIVIWIVKRARDEHRQAIEWLNNHTDDSAAFFLIEIELWKIGDSNPAPKFNVVERPNDWAKAMRISSNATAGETMKLKFWEVFNANANLNTKFTKHFKLRKPKAHGWCDLALGSSSYYVSLTVRPSMNYINAALYFPEDKALFETLKKHEEEIVKIMGGEVEWREAKKASQFIMSHEIDLSDEDNWVKADEWLYDMSLRVREVANKFLKG